MIILKLMNKFFRMLYAIQAKYVFLAVQSDGKISLGADVPGPFVVHCPENLVIGSGTSISGRFYVHAEGGVRIGRCCHIAQGLTVYSHNHNWKSDQFIPYDAESILRPVTIGDAVWIGANVTIAPGSKIGDGAIISAGSVVFGEVPSCAIVRGNPAEIIAYRDKEMFNKLYEEGKMI